MTLLHGIKKFGKFSLASNRRSVNTGVLINIYGAESSSFFTFAVAKDTPAIIVQTLSAKIAEVMFDPGIKTQFTELGAIPVGNTPAQATRYLNEQVIKWAKVVKASGAKADL